MRARDIHACPTARPEKTCTIPTGDARAIQETMSANFLRSKRLNMWGEIAALIDPRVLRAVLVTSVL